MSDLYRRVAIVDGETAEPVQYIGVYVLKSKQVPADIIECAFVEHEEPEDAPDLAAQLAAAQARVTALEAASAVSDVALHNFRIRITELEAALTVIRDQPDERGDEESGAWDSGYVDGWNAGREFSREAAKRALAGNL